MTTVTLEFVRLIGASSIELRPTAKVARYQIYNASNVLVRDMPSQAVDVLPYGVGWSIIALWAGGGSDTYDPS